MEAAPTRRPVLAAALIAAAAAFVLAGYEFLRTPTNTLFVTTVGTEHLPLVTALIPVAVALVTYLYVRLLSWLGPRRTLFVTSLGAVLLIGLGRLAFAAGFTAVVWPLFLFREAYVVLLIEQYWSFINSTLSQGEARKFNGPICGIASLGSIVAGVVGSQVAVRFGTVNMLLFAAAATVPAAFVSDLAYRFFGEPKPQLGQTTEAAGGHLALGLFKKEPVLPVLLMIIVATQVVAAVLGLGWQGVLNATYPAVDQQSAYSYGFFGWVNALAALLQFVAAPLLLHFVRPKLMHLLIPMVHIVACGFYLKHPSLLTMSIAYAAFKSVDYSIFRAVKEMLYIPLPFAARYRAKEVIDVFGYRVSKGLASGVVTVLQSGGVVFTDGVYAGVALAAAGIWAVLTVPLGRFYSEVSKS